MIGRLINVEVGLYLVLWVLYLLAPVYTPSKSPVSLDLGYYILSLNHFVIISSILFYLLPKYLSHARYGYLIFSILLMMLVGVVIEEVLLDPLLYPEGKGQDIKLYDLWHAMTQLVPTVVLFGAFKLIWDYKERKQRIEELEKEKFLTELNFLRTQLNPHVLFNTLTSIYSNAMTTDPKVAEMILKLATLMRYMLGKQSADLVPLHDEIDELTNFIELQKLRIPAESDIEFTVKGDLGTHRIAPMILISIVENCFKHSFNAHHFFVHIFLSIDGESLIFETKNSIGPPVADSSGIGMENIRKRLELQYPDRYELNIFSDNDCYNLRLQIDLDNEKN